MRRSPATEGLRLGDVIDRAAERLGDREALAFAGRRWSFRELRADVDRVARALLALGVAPGERIALWLPNLPEWLHVFYAAAKIGAVVVPINTRFRSVDLAHVLLQSGASVLIIQDRGGPISYTAIVRELAPEVDQDTPEGLRASRFPRLRHLLVLGDDRPAAGRRWKDALAGADAVGEATLAQRAAAVTPQATALIMYTSGTTGAPKGAMHGHVMTRTVLDAASRLGITARDVVLLCLPLFHSMGLYCGGLLGPLSGARGVLMERFEAGAALALIGEERVTYFAGFDTHFHDLMEHPEFKNADLRSLRVAFLPAGLASTEPVARRANRQVGKTVSGYGSTEVGTGACLSFLDSPEDERCRGSGYPLPGYEFKIVEPATGSLVAPGHPGEICVRGYAVMQGYHEQPDETARAIDGDGWFRTGDVGVLDEDGFLRLIGRYKEMLKVGGENVDPLEVEAFLLEHPALLQAKVVGIPDPRLGEVPVACVIPRPGQAVTHEDLARFCHGRIASFKVPRHVLSVESYPMTSSGKVQRFALREQVLERLARKPTPPAP